MTLPELGAWALMHLGLVYIVTESGIFSPVRRLLTRGLKESFLGILFVTLLYCTGCVGFWLGLLAGASGLTVLDERLGSALAHGWVRVLCTGFAGAGLGAWWGTDRASLSVMFQIEQGYRRHDPKKSREESDIERNADES